VVGVAALYSSTERISYLGAACRLIAHECRFESRRVRVGDAEADTMQLSSDLVRAPGLHGGFDGELLQWRILLCMTIGTSIGACIWKKVTKETSGSCTSAAFTSRHKRRVPKRGRRALEIRTSEAMGEKFPRIAALRGEKLAISPIQIVTGQSSARPWAAAACTTPALNPSETQTQLACTNTVKTLALSRIILTVDIPPSVPERVDDKTIMELSEMLQRW